MLPDAPVFQGHFPGDPTVPGVYLIEAMAQTLAFHQRIIYPDQNVLLAAIKSAKFRSVVRPGDLVVMEVEVRKSRLQFVEGLGVAKVDERIVAEVHCLGARVQSKKAEPIFIPERLRCKRALCGIKRFSTRAT